MNTPIRSDDPLRGGDATEQAVSQVAAPIAAVRRFPYPRGVRARAMLVIGGFSAVLVALIVLATVFEAGVQTVDAEGLVAVSDDAKEFFAADYVFIGLYAVLFPIFLWRFSSAIERSAARTRIRLAALLFVAAGIADVVENALLLSAIDSVSESTVDAGHLVAIPKIVLFVAASIFAVIALWRAIDELNFKHR